MDTPANENSKHHCFSTEGVALFTFHRDLLLLQVSQLLHQLPLLLPRQRDVGPRTRPGGTEKVTARRGHGKVEEEEVGPHSPSLLQVMDGDETFVHHSSHDLTLLPLLAAQNSPPLEELLAQLLQENQDSTFEQRSSATP